MMKRSTFDHLVEDPDFYVRVQKTKIVITITLLAIVLIAYLF